MAIFVFLSFHLTFIFKVKLLEFFNFYYYYYYYYFIIIITKICMAHMQDGKINHQIGSEAK